MTYSFAPVAGGTLQSQQSTLSASYAQISRFKDPILSIPYFVQDWFAEREQFDRTIEPIFGPIAEDLRLTKTKKLFEKKKQLHLKNMTDRNIFQNVTFGQNMLGSIANPTSYIPIFRAMKAQTMLGGATNFSITAGAVAGAEELPRAFVYADYDPVESGFYISSNVALGFLFGGTIKGVQKGLTASFDTSHRALNLHAQTIREQENFLKIENDLPNLAKKERKYAKASDLEVRSQAMSAHMSAMAKQKLVDRIRRGNPPEDFDPSLKAIESIERDIAAILRERDLYNQELNLRRFDKGLSQIDNPYSLAKSFYDAVDILPTPMKTILRTTAKKNSSKQFKSALNNFHRTALVLAGDGSTLVTGQKFGMSIPASVAIKNNLRRADLYTFEKSLTELWQKTYDMKQTMFFPETRQMTSGKGIALDDWIDDLNRRRILKDTNFNTEEAAAVQIIENFFKKMEDEGLNSGVIGSTNFLEQRVRQKEIDTDNAKLKLETVKQKEIPDYLKGKKRKEAEENLKNQIKYWENRVKELQDNVSELQQNLDFLKTATFSTSGAKEPYFMREFDSEAITIDERGPKLFRKILLEHVEKNPNGFEYNTKSGLWEPKELKSAADQAQYVDSIITGILSESDGTASSLRRSIHYPSRNLTIANSEILPFINTSVRDIVRKYNVKMGSRVDFANAFGDRTFKEVADEVTDDLISAGMSITKANELRKNLTILYRRVTGTSISDPTSLTNRSAQFLKEFTSLNYLGSAGPTALGDIPKIIMEQGFRPMVKGLVNIFDDPNWEKQFKQVKEIYGEALELSLGYVQRQILEESGSTVGSKAWDSIKQGGFILNGLGPMTVGLKSLSGTLSVHRFVETSLKVADGSASKFDLEYLARHGIDVVKAKEIAKAPVQRSKGLIISNLEEWSQNKISLETQLAFKAAVNQSVNNTILSSSPATRFTYADGSIFIRESVAKRLFPNFKPDEDFPGYVRLESGVMTLPFQFYNWSMSAATNILHTAAQGQIKNRYGGFAAMLGIGYLMAKIRTPEYVWDELTSEQKYLAAIERSGISSVYGDLAMNTVRALTQAGINDSANDPLNLAFYGKDGYAEAATTVLGSGVSTIKDFSDGVIDIYSGEYGSALKEFYLMLPYSELFWLKEDSRAMIDRVAKSIDE